jgi:hypothetical protein
MMKYKFKKSEQYKNWTWSRRTAPKQWNVALIESSGGAKIELFPGPVRLWTSWYDLILALLYREATKMTCGWPASCWTTGMCIKLKRNCDKSWYPSFISKWLMYMWVYIYIYHDTPMHKRLSVSLSIVPLYDACNSVGCSSW